MLNDSSPNLSLQRDGYDLFISYSHQDKEFVRRLWQVLQQSHKRIWWDQDSIPLTAKWREEIQEGIEKSDNFVFLISPDSVNSAACHEEIEHAINLNKRLMPVMYRYTSSKTVHEVLRDYQFIPLTEDDFEGGVHRLLTAIETDLAHVKTHTSLLVRALTWQRHEYDHSFLLHGGRELEEARQWLDQNSNKTPQPTELHREYITTSQQAEAERQAVELRLRRMTPQQYRNRQALLNKVQTYWVKGVLETSLQNRVLIVLGFEERLDTVIQPWNMTWETAEQPAKPIPPGTRIIALFDQLGAGRTLLILGEPGAGKTTALLSLARSLIARAEQGIDYRIPVVFNLSSWAVKKQAIATWVVEELNAKYQIPKPIGQVWVQEQQLLLLLDGLDEVQAESRDACVAALNTFQQQQGSEMVVTSRIRDYEALSQRLNFQDAVGLTPLTSAQIQHYLNSAGSKLAGLNSLMQTDPALQELARSPLMLNIMTLAYEGVENFPLANGATDFVEARRYQLFDAYIDRMFKRRRTGRNYSQLQAVHWLNWLAQQMVQQSQTIFLIEHLQPTWSLTRTEQMGYRISAVLMGALTCWLIAAVSGGLFRWSADVLLAWLILGVPLGLFVGLGDTTIQTVETLKWSWRAAVRGLVKGLFYGLIYGLLLELILELINQTFLKHQEWFSLGLVLITMLTVSCIFGVADGLRGLEIDTKTVPNQGIWRSALNASIVGLTGWLIGGLLFGPIFTALDPRNTTIAACSGSFGLLFGLILGGGQACIRHFTLRLVLYSKKLIPWNYARFLDHATDLIFLQKVGGGYIFIHRLLLEHFAHGIHESRIRES
nr:MAG: TIR domain-containing protein [Leptolyngbya sp. IPPAS B-1204]